MYFIFTMLSFLTLSLTAFGVSTQIQHEIWHSVFVGFGTVTGIATLVSLLAMMFQNMQFRNYIKEYINSIREEKRRIREIFNELERYKREFKSILTEMYPQYEKDIFKNMAQTDAKQLEMILVKYPELRFDGVLTNYVDGIKKRLTEINKCEEIISERLKRIANLNTNGWMLKEVVLPTDIQEIQNN